MRIVSLNENFSFFNDAPVRPALTNKYNKKRTAVSVHERALYVKENSGWIVFAMEGFKTNCLRESSEKVNFKLRIPKSNIGIPTKISIILKISLKLVLYSFQDFPNISPNFT